MNLERLKRITIEEGKCGGRQCVRDFRIRVSDILELLSAGASMEEIDRVILELQGVRDMLRSEGERVSRELAGYASLSHASMTAMKVIGDSLKQWKDAPINNGRRSAS